MKPGAAWTSEPARGDVGSARFTTLRHSGSAAWWIASTFLSLACPPATAASPDDLDEDDTVPIAVSASPPTAKAIDPKTGSSTPSEGGGFLSPLAGGEKSWVIPPVPWRAKLRFDASSNRDDAGHTISDNQTTLEAGANSYVYAPWFLTLNGFSSVAKGRSSNGADSQSVSGGMGMSALPRSRFPASIDVNAGETTTSIGTQRTVANFQNLFWRQQYAPEDRSIDSHWSYIANRFGTNGVSSLNQGLNGSIGFKLTTEAPQTLSMSVLANENRPGDQQGAGASRQSLSANHSIYLEDYVMMITSSGTYDRNRLRGSLATDTEAVLLQTQMNWIPSDDYPLTIGGSANQSFLRSSETQVNATSASLNGNYPINRNWSTSAGATGFRSDNSAGAVQTKATSVMFNSALAWRGDGVSKRLDPWDYVLGYGSTLSADYLSSKVGNESRADTSGALTANLDQSLVRTFDADRVEERPTLSLRQTASSSKSKSGTDGSAVGYSRLSHNADYSWMRVTSINSRYSVGLSASDGRSFGSYDDVFQTASASITGNWTKSVAETVGWSANLGLSRQSSSGVSGKWRGSGAVSASYSNSRFARVPNLLYAANYQLVLTQLNDQPNLDDPGGPQFALAHSFSQTWSWRLGLLSWQFGNTVSRDIQGNMNVGVRLTVSRDFGGVL